MASTLTVDNIVGATSASTVHVPGHVIQVVQNIGSAVTTNSATPTTVASASITIQATSKVHAYCVGDMNAAADDDWNYFRIYRDSTAIGQRYIAQAVKSSYNLPFSTAHLDTPGSAGTYTYTLKCWRGVGSMTYGEEGNGQAPTMILMEIAQ